MTLRELRYLVALADLRHFGRAAEACHVTQPTLSAQLKKLEDYLGQQLVDRQAKLPTLTPAGERIVERARRILAEADEILSLTRMRRGPLEGALNIGLIPTLAPYYLPSLLPLVRSQYPRCQLIVHEDMTRHLVEKLEAGQLDAALLALPAPLAEPVWTARALFDEPFYLACPPDHEIAGLDRVPEQTLAELRLLLLTDGHCLRGQALAACRQSDRGADDGDFRATSLETLRQLVAAGLGCTLLPALALNAVNPAGLVARPLASGESRRIGLVWRAGHERGAELELLLRLLRERLPAGVQAAD